MHVFFCFVAYSDCRKFEMLFKLTQNAKLTDTSLIYSPSAVCLMLCCYYLLPSQQQLIYYMLLLLSFLCVLVVFVAHCQPILLLPLFCSVYCVCVFLFLVVAAVAASAVVVVNVATSSKILHRESGCFSDFCLRKLRVQYSSQVRTHTGTYMK